MNDLGGFSELHFVRSNHLKRWQSQELGRFGIVAEFFFRLLRAQHISHASHIAQVADCFACSQSASDLQNGIFAHSESDEIRFRIQQNGPADFVAPVIVMSQSSQRRFDPARDHGHAGVGFASSLTVTEGGSIRTKSDPSARRIRVVVADFAIGRVVVDHGIHVPRADGEEQTRLAERLPWVARSPVRLTDNADSKTTGFQSPPENGHREAGMIDVCIAGDDHDIQFIPAAFQSFCHRHWQRL